MPIRGLPRTACPHRLAERSSLSLDGTPSVAPPSLLARRCRSRRVDKSTRLDQRGRPAPAPRLRSEFAGFTLDSVPEELSINRQLFSCRPISLVDSLKGSKRSPKKKPRRPWRSTGLRMKRALLVYPATDSGDHDELVRSLLRGTTSPSPGGRAALPATPLARPGIPTLLRPDSRPAPPVAAIW